MSWFGLISFRHFSNLSSSITLIIRGNLKFFQLVNLGSMPWFLVEQFKIQDLVVTLPKGWFMPNITYQTELRRHHKSPPSLRWRKFIFVLKKFKNREFWTHAGFYFFPDHLENRCQLVILVKKGFELELDGMNVSFFNSLHAYKNSGGTILRKQRKKRKSENISKIGIFGNLDLISQNSEFDCVDSFWFRKVDLLFCEIISKPGNPRIWCNLRKWIALK